MSVKHLAITCTLLAAIMLPSYAQQRRTATGNARKPAAVTRKKSQGQAAATQKKKKEAVTVDNLRQQQQQVKRNIREQEQRLRNNERDVRKRLQNLMIINTEIADKRRTIDTIRRDISTLDSQIELLGQQLDTLRRQLDTHKKNYVRSIRYMHRNRSAQSQLMFIFSADNFTQMYRRMRFVREYAAYQRTQGEEVKRRQAEVTRKVEAIAAAKEHKSRLLSQGEEEQRSLEGKQNEQQNVVSSLQRQQKTIQGIIAQQKKKDADLNAQIDRLIAEEIERQKARAAAEARRRAEAEAAKKRAAELARKKAEAEAAARENERRIAEARAREEKAKAAAQAARNQKAREEAERQAREAEEARLAAEQRAKKDAQERARDVATAQREADELLNAPTEDMRISGNFESNRGRLPVPITGPYRIVSHFGQYNVEGLNGVTLDNKGINIRCEDGAQARSIFDGEVSRIFGFADMMVVMVRHGSYISVYCNLASVSVRQGQKVTTRQALGRIAPGNIMQFQLRKEKAKLNPETWLGR